MNGHELPIGFTFLAHEGIATVLDAPSPRKVPAWGWADIKVFSPEHTTYDYSCQLKPSSGKKTKVVTYTFTQKDYISSYD